MAGDESRQDGTGTPDQATNRDYDALSRNYGVAFTEHGNHSHPIRSAHLEVCCKRRMALNKSLRNMTQHWCRSSRLCNNWKPHWPRRRAN